MLCVKKVNLLILLFFSLVFTACSKNKKENKTCFLSDHFRHFPYQVNKPSQTYVLTKQLREISGLAYSTKSKLLCINDEQGYVFEYDLEKKHVSRKIKFAKKGDFEAIEKIGKMCVVLRSDGKLYFIDNLNADKLDTRKVKTGLDVEDTEGLTYDSLSNSLLIACKGLAHGENKYAGKRLVYRYSIADKCLYSKPEILIDQNKLAEIMKMDAYTKFSIKILTSINPSKGNLIFQPSGIAIHPLSRNIYVLGSVGKLLLILNPKGGLLAAHKLKRKIFTQPEGICFAPDGTLFISTEGKSGNGKIYKFKYKP